MHKTLCAAAAALLASAAAIAQPEKPGGLWEGCGGDARASGFSKLMVGPKMAEAYQGKTPPIVTIEQCTGALAALGASAPWQQRAAYLRSRARAYVADMKPDEALADIAAIRSVEQGDPVYARSFGLSLTMLRALALVQKQDFDGAAAEAQAAMDTRPWSDRIALFAFSMLSVAPGHAEARMALLDRLVRYDPDLIELRAIERAAAQDWDGAARDWLRVKPAAGEATTTYLDLPNVRVTGAPGVPIVYIDENRAGRAALTLAMAGQADQARAVLTAARAGLANPPQLPGFMKNLRANLESAERGKTLERWAVLVDAANQLRAGQTKQALDTVQALDWSRAEQLQLAFLASLTSAAGASLSNLSDPKMAMKLLEEERLRRLRVRFKASELLAELPDHEEGSKTNAYRKQVMFLRASGFKSGPSKSGLGTDIHLFGDKLTPMAVSEMALLRAAEIAIGEGKAGFVITDRKGYRQTMQQTVYGSPIGPVANAGNGVDLTIVPVDPASLPAALQGSDDRVFDARQVQQALSALYAGTADAK